MVSSIICAVVALVICGAFLGLHFSNGNGGGSPPPAVIIGDLPDGISIGDDGMTLVSSEDTVWTVFDELHMFYNTNQFGSFTDRYTGVQSIGNELDLVPGKYTITAGGSSFDVVVNGQKDIEASWRYDIDGKVVDAHITYSIQISELVAEFDYADNMNDDQRREGYRFTNLRELVRGGDTVSDVADSLVNEYIRLGGDVSDAQSLLDFVAGFVQKSIRYPQVVAGHQYDYGIYGYDEYWAVPVQTLYLQYGDCEDVSALFCALASHLGFDVAMGGKSGHVFAGVVLEEFSEVPTQRLNDLGVGYMRHISAQDVYGSDAVYHAVELIKGQAPVGYSMSISFGSNTFWGITGFYPVRSW